MVESGPVPFEGRAAFRTALRRAFADLADSDCREVWLCDRDYADWPLNDPETIEQLSRWAFAHRRLVVLAADFEPLARLQPRFVEWRRRWDHVVSCRVVDAADADSIPCVFLAPPRFGLQRRDERLCRGIRATQPADIARIRSDIDAYLQRSQESFPVTTIGL